MEIEENSENSCDECSIKCENKESYENHMKSHHKAIGTGGEDENLEKNKIIGALQKEMIKKEETIKQLVIKVNICEDSFVEQTRKLKKNTQIVQEMLMKK